MTAQNIDAVLMLAARFVEATHWSRGDYEQILLAGPSTSPPTALIRRAFIALSDSNLAGFAAAGWLPWEAAAEVEGLVVDEKYRRQGMGSALIGACMEWAANAGAVSMRLEVRAWAPGFATLEPAQKHTVSAVYRRLVPIRGVRTRRTFR